MSIQKPYSDRAIRADVNRLIRLYPREQVGEAIVRYIGEHFIAKLSPKKGDHLQVDKDVIIGLVCGHFKMSLEIMGTLRRYEDIVYPRQIMSFFLATRTPMTLKVIGELFGQDHTTVMSSRNKIIDRYEKDPTIRKDVDELTNLLPKPEVQQDEE